MAARPYFSRKRATLSMEPSSSSEDPSRLTNGFLSNIDLSFVCYSVALNVLASSKCLDYLRELF